MNTRTKETSATMVSFPPRVYLQGNFFVIHFNKRVVCIQVRKLNDNGSITTIRVKYAAGIKMKHAIICIEQEGNVNKK